MNLSGFLQTGVERKKIVLIGAGSAAFTQGLVADFILAKDFWPLEIALVDIDSKALDSIAALTRRMVESKEADILVTAAKNRQDVLPGADVVVATVAVGGRRAWENDVFIPRKYGIFQPVGDTTMPGGISRALRMIPAMLDIARDVQRLCPAALFINYSNPMSAICAAIRKTTEVKVVGLCHGVNGVEHYLARFIGFSPSKVKSLAAGINHLTFLYDFRVEGRNAWPLVNARLSEQKAYRPVENAGMNTFPEMGGEWSGKPVYWEDPFSWSIYERYGVFPAVLDRHVTEFFPERFPEGRYYGKVLGIDAFSFEGTIAHGDKEYEEMHQKAAGKREISQRLFQRSPGEHEQLVDILRSIRDDERKIFSVNLRNEGAIPNLPTSAILELPAVASGDGFYPLFIPHFPEAPAALLRRRISVIDMTVEAALSGDRWMFVEALLLDGAVRDEETAARLAEDLLEAHKEHLPQYFNN